MCSYLEILSSIISFVKSNDRQSIPCSVVFYIAGRRQAALTAALYSKHFIAFQPCDCLLMRRI